MNTQAVSFVPASGWAAEWDPATKPHFGGSRRGRFGSDTSTFSGSTAAPSPVLTCNDEAAEPTSPWGQPSFALPRSAPSVEEKKGNKPFTLNGLEDFASSLAGLLASASGGAPPPLPPLPFDLNLCAGTQADDAHYAPLSLPPGLGPSNGDYDAAPAPPPGLQAATGGSAISVSELHAIMRNGGHDGRAPNGGYGVDIGKRADAGDDTLQQPHNDIPENAAGPLNLPADCTTVMLRNIPNKYTQEMLVTRLHKGGYRGEVDFVYLPVDFKNKCNMGYAFLNFRTVATCMAFAEEFHGANSWEKLPGFRSRKVCTISVARFQGRDENVARLQTSPVMAQLASRPDWLPQVFDEYGEEVEFSVPGKSRSVSACNGTADAGYGPGLRNVGGQCGARGTVKPRALRVAGRGRTKTA